MSCARKNCDNIMCKTYIEYQGYICYDCKAEFQEKITERMTEGEMLSKLKDFFQSDKQYTTSNDKISVNEFFDRRIL